MDVRLSVLIRAEEGRRGHHEAIRHRLTEILAESGLGDHPLHFPAKEVEALLPA